MSKNKLNGLSRVERKPLIYDPIIKKCYDGEMHFKATHKEINAWSVTNSFKSEYIPIKCPDDKTLEEGHADFVKQADKLKEQSKGRINLYLSGTLKKASLALFFYMANAKGYVPEELTEMETEWFINCNHGQLVFVDPMYKDRKSHSYDINSMYPSLMRDQHFKIPMKQGTFTTLTQDAWMTPFNLYSNTFSMNDLGSSTLDMKYNLGPVWMYGIIKQILHPGIFFATSKHSPAFGISHTHL